MAKPFRGVINVDVTQSVPDKDAGEPVTDDYPGQGPWAFTGGTIKRAAVDVSGAPFVDLAAEARMAFMRD